MPTRQMPTRRALGPLLAAAFLARPAIAMAAAPAEELMALYRRFVAAQNARDLAAVRLTLWDQPDFLWVSDGRSVWGREAALARMAGFQQAPVWRVEPDLAQARPVVLDAGAGYLHLPLTLVIGAAEAPDRLRFLVSMLGIATGEGWRIAALLTTTEKGA